MYSGNDYFREDLQSCASSIVGIDALANKKILITGATGLIGSFLVDELLYLNEKYGYGITVFALARDEMRLKNRFSSHLNDSSLKFVIGDVTGAIQLDEEVDFMIHAAGDGFPAAFREHPFETMTPAVIGTVNLLEYAQCHNVKRFLYLSSGEVYGVSGNENHPFQEDEAGSLDSMNVRSCYPNAKKCAETLCASFYAEYGLECVVARLSHTYGACVSVHDNRATVQFMDNAVRGRDIVLHSRGTQVRSYTYVADAVSGLLSVLLNGNAGEAYNIANSASQTTVVGIAEKIAQVSGVNVTYELPDKTVKKELTPIEYAVLDASKLGQLGWKAAYDIEHGVKNMYHTYGA